MYPTSDELALIFLIICGPTFFYCRNLRIDQKTDCINIDPLYCASTYTIQLTRTVNSSY
jgi:hypothetical protein